VGKVAIITGEFPEPQLNRRTQWANPNASPVRLQLGGTSTPHRLLSSNIRTQLGIGRATAHQYAHNGLKALYICDYDSSNLKSLQAEIEAANPGVKVHARTFDASSEEAVQAVCEEAVATYGRLDIFYANAGISGSALTPVTDIAVDQFMWTLKTNVVR